MSDTLLLSKRFTLSQPKMMSRKSSKKGRKAGSPSAATNGQPFFDEVFVTLPYTDRVAASATGAVYVQSYTQNDCFDPDVTGAGSQPLGFDTWQTMYGRWTVVSSSIEVRFCAKTANGEMELALVPTPNTTTGATFVAAASMRYAKASSTANGAEPVSIKHKITTASLFGVPDSVIQGNPDYSGTASTSPALRSMWSVVIQTSGATDSFNLYVTIKYRVRFWLPNVIVLSATRRLPALTADKPTPGFATTPLGPEPPAGPVTSRDDPRVQRYHAVDQNSECICAFCCRKPA